MTVNALPEAYTGRLTILLNDREPYITLRNVLLLSVLGSGADPRRAADIALHFWYSIFLPEEYRTELLLHMTKLAMIEEPATINTPLGSCSSLQADISHDIRCLSAAYIFSTRSFHIDQALGELGRIQFNPSRADQHHRRYCKIEPSHRLACLEYRRFGLLLPFGAHNADFSAPNYSMFSLSGKWLQPDFTDPLHSWDIQDVVKSGAAHGASREDIYGCLYFHITDILRKFIARLSSHNICFKIFTKDAIDLGESIKRNECILQGFSSTTLFDRIDTSNILDFNYAGLERTISTWGSLLKRTDDARIFGLFMNWPVEHAAAKPGATETGELMEKLMDLGRIPPLDDFMSPVMPMGVVGTMSTLIAYASFTYAMYNNEAAFEEYLRSKDIDGVLRRTGLKRLSKHVIVPPRVGVPVGAPFSTLPIFDSEESWYLQVNMGDHTWTERYIELGVI